MLIQLGGIDRLAAQISSWTEAWIVLLLGLVLLMAAATIRIWGHRHSKLLDEPATIDSLESIGRDDGSADRIAAVK